MSWMKRAAVAALVFTAVPALAQNALQLPWDTVNALNPNKPVQQSPTRLDVADFRRFAELSLSEALGQRVMGGTVLFQDGASSLDLPPAFDHATLLFVPNVQPALPDGVKVAWAATLQGASGVRLISHTPPDRIKFKAAEATVTLTDGAPQEQVNALRAELESRFPGSKIIHLETSGILSWTPPELGMFYEGFTLLQSSPVTAAVEVGNMNYRIPFEFSDPVDLGPSQLPNWVDLRDLTSVTKDLRNQGYPFTTEPSLPVPFGPGPIANPPAGTP